MLARCRHMVTCSLAAEADASSTLACRADEMREGKPQQTRWTALGVCAVAGRTSVTG